MEGRHLGVIFPRTTAACGAAPRSQSSDNRSLYGSAKPQLKINGGDVMGTPSQPGDVTLTPIFWVPSGTTMAADYQSGIAGFDAAVAAASGQPTNVFALQTQYTDGQGRRLAYRFSAGAPIVDTQAFPAARLSASCQPDAGAVYNDMTGYTACLTDDQIAAALPRLAAFPGIGHTSTP